MHTSNGSLLETLQRVRNDAIRVQEQTWRLELSLSPNPILRLIQRAILGPLVNSQREYNAAVLRSMYALAEQIDHTTQLLFQLNKQISNLEAGLQDYNQRQIAEIHQIGQQIRDFADQLAGLEETTTQILAHIGGVLEIPPQQSE